jgi:ribosome biogenesis GTPase / thiamine phosphate phosphatase
VAETGCRVLIWQDVDVSRIDIEALEDEWEEHDGLPPRRSRELSQKAKERIESLGSARVVGVDRGRITIVYEGVVTDATLAGTMRGTKAAVGDEVRVRPPRHESDLPRIVEVLPRHTALLRTADDEVDDERVVVANADQVVVVLAADHLDAGVRFLDRVLVAASVGGLDPVLCINKMDLADREAVDEVARRYERVGVTVCPTSVVTREGIDRLREVLAGCWSAFTGHSGVGKSSLFNVLVPEADREVGELGSRGGRHVTVAARAMPIRALDAWLVDTPGVRSFGLGALAPGELGRHFPELAELSCELADCAHDTEPGCRLPEADIHPARLESYRRLLAALRGT